MSVRVLSEKRAFLSRQVSLSHGRFWGPPLSAWWMSSFTALMYVFKARSLSQGDVCFNFFLNQGISSLSLIHRRTHSIEASWKIARYSRSIGNGPFLMVLGRMKGPLRPNRSHHSREGYSRCLLLGSLNFHQYSNLGSVQLRRRRSEETLRGDRPQATGARFW